MNTGQFLIPPSWMNHSIDVFVLGCGGTGSHFVDGLARLNYVIQQLGHPGLQVTVYDGDSVSAASVARQRFYPCDIGENKALLTVHRLNMAYGFKWEAMPIMFDTSEWKKALPISLPDLIVSCVDKAKFRAEIAEIGVRASEDALFLDMGNSSHEGNVILGHWNQSHSDTQRLPNVVSFYPELATLIDDDEPTCSMEESLKKQTLGINQAMATIGCTLLWLLLREGRLAYQGAFVDLRKGKLFAGQYSAVAEREIT